MEDVIKTGSFTPRRKITNLEDMTPRGWAEVTMDFLAFCKPFITGYNTEYYTDWYTSSLCFGLNQEEGSFRELSNFVRCSYLRSCSQRVAWGKCILPQGMNWNTKAFRLCLYKNDMGEGQVQSIVITRDADLLLCKATFLYSSKIEESEKNAYATECTVEVANDENLTVFFAEEQRTAQTLLDRLYTHTKDLIRLEQERITDEKIQIFTKVFEERIIAHWGVIT